MVYGICFNTGGDAVLIKFIRPFYWITAIIHTIALILFIWFDYIPTRNMVAWYMIELFVFWWAGVFIISNLEVKNENKNIR
jgi:hypothetical protein